MYISSVHAMSAKPQSEKIRPAVSYDPDSVPALHPKTKAKASASILEMIERDGLDACIIQPSGLVGPNDYDNTNMSQFFAEVCNEKLPVCVDVGYSFADIRDAASAILAACKKGRCGQSYIVANKTISMMEPARKASFYNRSRPVKNRLAP